MQAVSHEEGGELPQGAEPGLQGGGAHVGLHQIGGLSHRVDVRNEGADAAQEENESRRLAPVRVRRLGGAVATLGSPAPGPEEVETLTRFSVHLGRLLLGAVFLLADISLG